MTNSLILEEHWKNDPIFNHLTQEEYNLYQDALKRLGSEGGNKYLKGIGIDHNLHEPLPFESFQLLSRDRHNVSDEDLINRFYFAEMQIRYAFNAAINDEAKGEILRSYGINASVEEFEDFDLKETKDALEKGSHGERQENRRRQKKIQAQQAQDAAEEYYREELKKKDPFAESYEDLTYEEMRDIISNTPDSVNAMHHATKDGGIKYRDQNGQMQERGKSEFEDVFLEKGQKRTDEVQLSTRAGGKQCEPCDNDRLECLIEVMFHITDQDGTEIYAYCSKKHKKIPPIILITPDITEFEYEVKGACNHYTLICCRTDILETKVYKDTKKPDFMSDETYGDEPEFKVNTTYGATNKLTPIDVKFDKKIIKKF